MGNNKMVGLLLAGGQGSRLKLLTKNGNVYFQPTNKLN